MVILRGIPACVVTVANAVLMPQFFRRTQPLKLGVMGKGERKQGSYLSPGITRPSAVLGGFLDDAHRL